MDVLQAWLVAGIPGLVVVGSLFAGRSATRTAIGYFALAGLLVFFLLVAEDTASAVAVGTAGVLLLAIGRGGPVEAEPDHHERRKVLQHAHTEDVPGH